MGEVKDVLAAYLAEKHLLGEGEDGWQNVKTVYREPDRDRYFEKLRGFLKEMGYDMTGGSKTS